MERRTRNSIFFFLFLFFIPGFAFSHSIPFDISTMPKTAIGWEYLKMGFEHILPLGADHILFVLGIFLLRPDLKTVIYQATAFTIAHSITLGLAVYGLISPPGQIIEPIIALSIAFIGIENILVRELKWGRIIIVFLFGLIHGCGFAGALKETGLPENDFLLGLLSFNVGVEAGQISVILIAYFLFGKWLKNKTWYHNRVTVPLSIVIALAGIYWTIERL